MTQTVHELALQAVHDALSLAGPADDGGGFIRTCNADTYMGDQRFRLARVVLAAMPPGTTAATAEAVAITMAPVVRAALNAQ